MELPAQDLSPAKAYHVLTHVVAPRPIAWITTQHGDVVNAAPFSWFQAVCADPPMVMVAIVDRDGKLKDTARNAIASKEFVVNLAAGNQLQDLVDTSRDLPADQSEVDAGGLATTSSVEVGPPRIEGCAAHLECRLVETHRYGRSSATTLLIGEVVHVAMRDDLLNERGMLDAAKAQLPARLGGVQYLRVNEVLEARQS